MVRITIEQAKSSQADELTLIAHASKRYWGYPENWIENWKEELTVTEDFIRNNQVFVAKKSKKVTAAFYAFIKKEDRISVEHFWVLPEFMGNGIGKKLFQHVIKTATSNNIKWIEIVSDPNAVGFYQKMGAKEIGELVTKLDSIERRLPVFKYTLEASQ